jgi:N-acetylglucosaminyldiphosphoundecaprenol N-acetyl-beta-D-mannosaminyltransferase
MTTAPAPRDLDELAGSGERPVERRDSGIRVMSRGPAPLPAMDVFGVPVNVAPFDAVRAWFFECAFARERLPKIVHFAGSRSLVRAWSDVTHRSLLARADLVLAEGACLGAYAALAAAPTRPRFDAVSTLFALFAAASPEAPVRVFLLGGERGRAARAAELLTKRFPGVRIVGATHAHRSLEDVNEACADVLLVGGAGADTWVDENVELLDVGIVASVGDAIDALGGDGCRAPRATAPLGPLAAIAFLVRATLYLAFRVRPRAFR